MKISKTAAAGITVLMVLLLLIVSGCGKPEEDGTVINNTGTGITILFFTAPG